MDFVFSEDQEMLRSAVRGYLERHNDFAARTAASRSAAGWSEPLWQGLAQDLGILGIAIHPDQGGTGGSPVELMLVMEELGANLTVEPFLETAVIAPALLGADQRFNSAIARIAAGEDRYAFAWAEQAPGFDPARPATTATRTADGWQLSGHKSVVTGAPWADYLLITAMTDEGVAIFRADAATPGIALSPYPTIDGRRAADIVLDTAHLPAEALVASGATAATLIEHTADLAAAMLGAEALGVMRCLLDDTLAYTRQRRQFGRPISDFQVLQHRMVDMYMHLELARSAVYRAVLMLEAAPVERAKAVSAMKVTVGESCRFTSQNAVQLHGGMGMTDELPVSHYFKRAMVIEGEFGSPDFHLQRFVRLTAAA